MSESDEAEVAAESIATPEAEVAAEPIAVAEPAGVAGYRVVKDFDERWPVGTVIPHGVLDYRATQRLIHELEAIEPTA